MHTDIQEKCLKEKETTVIKKKKRNHSDIYLTVQ